MMTDDPLEIKADANVDALLASSDHFIYSPLTTYHLRNDPSPLDL
jgi:hypothetical protein